MIKNNRKHHVFYGTTTLGEKGQVVIPSEARVALSMRKGEKLMVFGMAHGAIVLSKVSGLEKMASKLSEKLKGVQELIDKTTE